MHDLLEDYRRVRATEQRAEMYFRLNEMLATTGTMRRMAGSLRGRMDQIDIPADSRGFMLDDLKQVRASVLDALDIIEEVLRACEAPAPVKMLEAAE